jgi:hypothetical protein
MIAEYLGKNIKIESTCNRKRPAKSEVERLIVDNAKAKKK